MTFGDVINGLKKNKTAKRTSWDGAFIEYVPETENVMAAIAVTLWNGKRVIGWNPTVEDLFATDWVVE